METSEAVSGTKHPRNGKGGRKEEVFWILPRAICTMPTNASSSLRQNSGSTEISGKTLMARIFPLKLVIGQQC